MNQKRWNVVVPALAIILNENNDVLLIKRNDPGDRWHNKWEFPGGFIENHEQPSEAAIREAREESGIEIEIIRKSPIVMCQNDEERKLKAICIGYFAKPVGGTVNFENDSGVNDARWFAYKDINFSDCLPLIKEFLDEAAIINNL